MSSKNLRGSRNRHSQDISVKIITNKKTLQSALGRSEGQRIKDSKGHDIEDQNPKESESAGADTRARTPTVTVRDRVNVHVPAVAEPARAHRPENTFVIADIEDEPPAFRALKFEE